MRRSFKYLSAILFLFVCITSYADSNKGQMELGNEAYKEGRYQEAIDYYQHILETGNFSKELYYNLGNAMYKSGKLPEAILYYEKARVLDPNDEDVLFNLGIANAQIVDEIEEIPEPFLTATLRDLIQMTSSNTWAIIALIAFLLFLSGLAFYFMNNRKGIRQSSFYIALIALIVFIGGLSFARTSQKQILNNGSAIVFTPTVNIKSSPDENGTKLFILHEGSKVEITDSLGNWFEIKLKDGNSGWLKNTDIQKI